MHIFKKINNNVALAKDGNDREMVVFGKGIGFPAMPYELTDLSKIQRTFYSISSNYINIIGSLPEDMILLASDLAELAKCELECSINPNLPFTLADHLNFALERFQNGLEMETPLAYDIAHFYPRETELGRQGLELIRERKGVRLPEQEAVSIALHLVNSEMENSDMHTTMVSAKIIGDITAIVEETLQIELDTTGFNYSRFVLHLRYLIQRLQNDEQEISAMGRTFVHMQVVYPEAYRCSQKVVRYLKDTWNWRCNDNEELYLFMHINRVKERNDLFEGESV